MLGQAGPRDPDVAVDIFLASRPGTGVVVDAGALDAGAVTRGGGIVDGYQEAAGILRAGTGGHPGAEGHGFGAAADRVNGVVSAAKVVADAAGAEPGGSGATTGGQEDAPQQAGQAGGAATVEPGGEAAENARQPGGQVR